MELCFSSSRLVIVMWECYSILAGTLFHIIWNIVPSYLEQDSISSVTRHELFKHVAEAF